MSVIFLLGAGASRDAGMPLVSELTDEIRTSLREIRDPVGECGEEAHDLFEAVTRLDDRVEKNYEAFFEWIEYLRRATREPFSLATKLELNVQRLARTVNCLAWGIKRPIVRSLLGRRQRETYDPAYLSQLADFLPERGRLHVFTTNYDVCVEEACRSHGINVLTGFSAKSGKWTPSVFRGLSRGMNLYKLHGSLNWTSKNDRRGSAFQDIIEHPIDWNGDPELVLGPGPKLQFDEPFVTLYSEFHRAVRKAHICVAIGCSLADEHIRNPISRANQQGMAIVDVNPSHSGYAFGGRIERIPKGAKEALETGDIVEAVRKVPHKR